MCIASDNAILESICTRLQEAMKNSGTSIEDLHNQAMTERARIVERLYLRPKSGSPNRTRRPVRKNRE